jgi:hypothetical protein
MVLKVRRAGRPAALPGLGPSGYMDTSQLTVVSSSAELELQISA